MSVAITSSIHNLFNIGEYQLTMSEDVGKVFHCNWG